MKIKLFVPLMLALLATLNSQLSTTFAQGTAFTYQGRFSTNGAPASADVEFQFTLWNALGGGSQVASATPATTIVTVTNGLFTVPIDFGVAVFDGADRYLQIEARTAIGPFTLLTPRQKITATPYALLAGRLSGTLANNGLAGTYGNAVTLSNFANLFNGTFVGNGGGLSNLNASSLGGLNASNFWKTSGNAGTAAGVNFLGTTDDQPLELRAGGQRVMRLVSSLSTNTGPGYSVIYSNAPNVIGGAALNAVAPGVFGATIGGGGLGAAYVDMGAGYTFAGSYSNHVAGSFGTIGGGVQNLIALNAAYAFIGGGYQNTIASNSTAVTIGGGSENTIATNASYAIIGGGDRNMILNGSSHSTIGGGIFNTISNASSAVIAGGSINHVLYYAPGAFIGGGAGNVIGGGNPENHDNSDSVIGGGFANLIHGNAYRSFIGGGDQNTNFASDTVIGGGQHNFIGSNATYAVIVGGYSNAAAGAYTFAGGRRAKAMHNGAFVWGDSQNADFSSTANNQFLIRAAGGVGIGSAVTPNGALHLRSGGLAISGASSPYSGVSSGVFLEFGGGIGQIFAFDYDFFVPRTLILNSPGGFVGIGRTPTANTLEVNGNASKSVAGNWLANSDARIKTDIKPVQDAMSALEKVRLVSFRYNDDYLATHRGVEDRRYLNVIAQEFQRVFPDHVKKSGEKLPDGSEILQVDTYPLTIYSAAAIQELNQKVEQQLEHKETEIAKLKKKNAELEFRLGALEKLMNHLTVTQAGAK